MYIDQKPPVPYTTSGTLRALTAAERRRASSRAAFAYQSGERVWWLAADEAVGWVRFVEVES